MDTIFLQDLDIGSLLSTTLDLICIAQRDGHFRQVNPVVLQRLGYSWDELKRMPILDLIHPDDRELTAVRRRELFEGKPLVNFRNRYLSKTGEVIWLDWTSVYMEEYDLVFAIARDVTERTLSELELEAGYARFRGLAAHFRNRMERDRRHLANHLHEQLAQLGASIKLDLEWLSLQLKPVDPAVQQRMQHVLTSSQVMINTIRNISNGIGTSILDDLGLEESLQWLCEECSIHGGSQANLHVSGEIEALAPELKLDLYRISQDVCRHFQQDCEHGQVAVRLEVAHNRVALSFHFRHCDLGLLQPSEMLENLQGLVNMIEGRMETHLHDNMESSLHFYFETT